MGLTTKIVILVTIFGLFGCTKKTKEESNFNRISYIYSLLDKGNAQAALSEAESLFEENPENRQAQMAVVSAHMVLAGLDIQSFFPLFHEFVSEQWMDQAAFVPSRTSKKDVNNSAEVKFESISKSLFILHKFLKFFAAVPVLDDQQHQHLLIAQSLLQDLKPLSKGQMLVDALLVTAKYKATVYHLAEGKSETKKDKKGKCYLEIQHITIKILESLPELELVLSKYVDVLQQSQQQGDSKVQMQKMMESVQQLQIATQDLTDLEWNKIKQTLDDGMLNYILQQVKGVELKCYEN